MDKHLENKIIERIKNGAIDDFELLVRSYQEALFRIVGHLIYPDHQHEDLVQDIFLAIFANIHRFDPQKGSFRGWIYTIARNRAYNARRKYKTCDLPDENMIISNQRTPADEMLVKEAFTCLDNALHQLSFQERIIFVLAELEGLTYAEIASIELLPLGTVKSRLARVRAKLRDALSREDSPGTATSCTEN